jgi:UDP-glucose 4-epimerase
MKILVTGGCGFIGHELIKKLKDDPDLEIYSLDISKTSLVSADNVKYFVGSTKNIRELISFKPDIVYHLGEYSRIATSFQDIEILWDLNIAGTFEVLQFCRERGSKLVYAGSSSKFGNNGADENLSPYSWVKAKNVELIKNYGDWFGIEYAIAYFFNVYGASQISKGKYATVIGIFEELYKKGKPLTVVKPGTQKRYFTHIDDTIAGLIKIGHDGTGDGYCLCDTESLYSVEEAARLITGNITYVPEQSGNREQPVIPSFKCYEELSWVPSNSLSDYIDNMKKECEK